MRTVAVVTVARSDYGIYRPILRRLSDAGDVRLAIVAGGMHLSPVCGLTVRDIEADGFAVAARVDFLDNDDSPAGIAAAIGRGVAGYAEAFARLRPDILVVLGDRFDMYPAAVAALPQRIPVAHIHGGELTFGAIDDALRHSITKLSHLHFVATEEYARRVAQLGEEQWRITVSGAPGLDNVHAMALLDAEELARRFHVRLDGPFLLCTWHPATLEFEQTQSHVSEMLGAIEATAWPVVFTQPNADTGGAAVRRAIDQYVRVHADAALVDNLGTQAYFSLMARAAAMVGNSSSGLIEAPSFELPVVNIGSRQAGRVRARNVIDVGCSRSEVLAGLRHALDPRFRESLRGLINPYGSGHASERIVARLRTEPLGPVLVEKRFRDASAAEAAVPGMR